MSTVPRPSLSPPEDRLDLAWITDKAVKALMFIGGISAIIFILGIFAFIMREGLSFVFDRFDFLEFFASIRWAPTSVRNPTYGALALMVGTASVTGSAMLVAIPFSLGAAVELSELAGGCTRVTLTQLWERSRRVTSLDV